MANDLKWADVAHMYSDIDIVDLDGEKMRNASFDRGGKCLAIPYVKVEGMPLKRLRQVNEYLPILRHLEDMTEAEALELWNYGRGQDWINMQHTSDIYYDSPLCWYRFNRFGDINRQFTAKEIYWLYKNGFDIHGLIESDQAIRKEVGNGNV